VARKTAEPASVARLREHAALMELLTQVSQAALESGSLEERLHRIANFLYDRLPVAIASILLLDASGSRFVSETDSGDLPLDFPDNWPVSKGACGRCARTGETQLVLDVRKDPDYMPGHPNVKSEYIVPIRYQDRMLGVLNLESTRRDTFNPQARKVFDAVALQIAGAIHLARVNDELQKANAELERMSTMDALTGVANRRRFDDVLLREWRRAARRGTPLTVMLADLDRFKALNDSRGHLHGDACLRKVAQILNRGPRRAGELLARYGGEEFALVFPDTDLAEARVHAETLRAAVAGEKLAHGGSPGRPYITISIGAASEIPTREQRPEHLIALADQALYRAKRGGRNRVVALGGASP
jgi:diguanylate cyclase (GGDEF)-like protein